MSLLDAIEDSHRRVLTPSGGCHNCPRRRVDFVPPTLRQTQTLWLGEAPGENEVTNQEGFTGKSGELLRRSARQWAGLTDEQMSFSNVIHCRPPNNATPSPKEVSCCLSQFVLDEIRGYPIVVLCGHTPLTALFPKAQGTHFRGNVAWHPDFPGQRFYNIYHPAYILRRPDLTDQFRQQLERLGRILRGEPAPKWKLHQGGSPEFFEALRAQLGRPLLSLDLETPKLESWHLDSNARSLALTGDGINCCFAHSGEPHWPVVLQLVKAYLENPKNSVVGSHIAFDLDWLEHELDFSVQVTGVYEISVLYYQVGQYKQPSLKELVSRELDGYRYLIHNPHHNRDMHLLAHYNAEDVIYPVELLKKALRALRPNTRDLVTRVQGPASLCLRQITSHGFYVREDYRRAKIAEYQERRRQVITKWKDLDPCFIPSTHESGKGMHEYLFDIHKLPVLERSKKTDAPSMDESSIRQWIAQGATFLEPALEMREIDKLLSTYLEAYDKHIERSRIHSDYTQTYTDSGRSSSRDPNVQNIPRKKEIRDLFGVPPGYKMLEADLNQIEFRIMVCLAKDENGIAAYLRGEDAHSNTARAMAAMAGRSTFTKEERSCAKPINFGTLYGGEWGVIQAVARNDYGMELTKEQCQAFRDLFMRTYPRIGDFHTASRQKLITNGGWFESVVGHVFYYEGWDSPDEKHRDHIFRAALNSEAQGPAAQICFAIMVNVRRALDRAGLRWVRFVNTVHDSLVVEIPPTVSVESVIEIFEAAVAVAYQWVKPWLVVPLLMEYKVGESWGSLEEVKVK